MKKNMFSLIRKMMTAVILGCLGVMLAGQILPVPSVVYAAEHTNYERVIDQAGLLSVSEIDNLIKQFDAISEKHKFDVTVVTLEDINGMDPEDAAWGVYQEAGYGQGPNLDGVVLMLSMAERDWAIEAAGFGETAINEDARDYLIDQIIDDLHNGNYYEAFATYGDVCDALVTQAEEGKPYKKPFAFGFSILISLITGLIGGGGTVGALKSNLKSVHSKSQARQYVKNDSFRLTESRDRFLYRNITRTRIPKNENSGRSGGGGGHSGSHGKF